MPMKNIVLVGMPSAGKSTIGIILAKVLGYQFLDSDLLIQEQEKELLKDIIDKRGIDGFLAIENQINREIDTDHTVIATGGSVIYGVEAMEHLQETGVIVYIKLTLQTISERLGNIKQRGVVLRKGQTLKMLYEERCPLYEKYAHITVDGENLNTEELMENIKDALEQFISK
jgi:shikimate kinase